MENTSNTTSRQELEQLRSEGKINETEYRELLEAVNKPAPGQPKPTAAAEPQFEAFRVRLLTGGLALCAMGLPIGLALRLPYVWVLAILGMIVAPVKLSRIRGSWLANMLERRK
ncbi:MAG: hypothetical protein JXN61_12425 [Sedimentisphaerales bacterium]|nr:hypothetical protein [Sedimentisphaerales bacterium]